MRVIICMFFATCLLNTASAQAPAWVWGLHAGETETDRGADITIDAAGNLIGVGSWTSTGTNLFGVVQDTFYNGTGGGYIAKFDTAGTVLWVRSNGLNNTSVVTDPAGNIYTIGNFFAAAKVNGVTYSASNQWANYVAKYNSNGAFQWVKVIKIGTLEASITSLGVDANGNAYIAGSFELATLVIDSNHQLLNHSGADDMFFVKYDPAGNVLWAKSYGGTAGEGFTSLNTDADNNIIATATIGSTQVIFGTDTFTKSTPGGKPLVLKFDPTGNVLWMKTTTVETTSSISVATILDNSNNIYMNGYFADSLLIWDNDTLVNPLFPNDYPYFLAKFTPGGSLAWAQVDAVTPYATMGRLVRSATGEFYQVGRIGAVSLHEDLGVAKYDSVGNYQWTLNAPSTSPSSWYGYNVRATTIDGASNVYFIGTYYDHDGYMMLGNDTIIGSGIFVGKMNPTARTCTSSASFTYSNQQNIFDFQNTSTGDSLSYLWNFGDGSTSTDTSATHTFAPGNYNVCLRISDGAGCIDTSCTAITVPTTNQDLVWPGDANHDGIANNFDLLAIGAGFGVSGPVRANATTNWVGQPASDWLLQLAGGANLKHVDCDGDGTIGFDDVDAIALNYGLTHAKGGSPGRMAPGDLFLVFPLDSFFTSDTVHGEIHLGTTNTPVNNVYGIAFSLTYDQNIVDSGSVNIDFVNSWMAPDGSRASLTKDLYTASKIDAGVSRINHTNISGAGKIADISFVIQDNIDGKDFVVFPLEIQFEDVLTIDKDEAVVSITANGDTLYIKELIDNVQDFQNEDLRVFPNPASGEVFVRTKTLLSGYRIADVTGKEISKMDNLYVQQFSIDLKAYEPGIYFVTLQSTTGKVVRKKLIVSK